MNTTTKLLGWAIVTVLLFGVPAGFAADDGARKGVAIEEMTVTARRMEEDLQSTPISIAAFSGDGLEERGMTNIAQIAPFVPNLSFQNNPSFGGAGNAAAIYIRGVGQKEFLPTTEPGVGLYVDDVYIARSVGGILDLIDIERVEVLRGPQGTIQPILIAVQDTGRIRQA
jgi:iron complex outermembrane receptor protein